MCIMKELSDDSEYANFQLRSQNLRNQASRLEKTLGNVTELIVNKWGVGNTKRRQQEQLMESENSDLMRRSNRNFNIPPSPGKPRAFDYTLCPGSGEFDLSQCGVGKIEPDVLGFK